MFKMGYLDDPSDHTKLSIRKFFSDYSKVYGLLRRFRFEFRRKLEPFQDPWVSAKESAGAHPAYTQIFNNGQFRTIFTPQYRFSVLNLKDPRILEGFKISLRAIKRMNEICRHKDIRFLVVLIPTKELVFSELPNNPSGAYNILTDSEVKFRMITKDFFERNRIEYLDVLPALLRQLDNGNQPYKVSWDGHPNEKGHSAIARLIRKYLKENIFGQNN